MSDLVCLVADKNMEAAVDGLLKRPEALGIRPVNYELLVHPRRDPGCFHEATEFLRTFQSTHAHALVILDASWEGAPASTGDELEKLLCDRLRRAGLWDWAEPIVIDPELEVWVFSDSPWVEHCLGWSDADGAFRAWLEAEQLWPPMAPKPPDPKFVVERVLYRARKPRSSSIYRELAGKVSLERCSDGAFLRLKMLLRKWLATPQPPREAL